MYMIANQTAHNYKWPPLTELLVLQYKADCTSGTCSDSNHEKRSRRMRQGLMSWFSERAELSNCSKLLQ